MNKVSLSLLATVALLLSSCTLAPTYERPAPPVPPEWPKGPSYQEQATRREAPSPATLEWRLFFPDEQLKKIIELALDNNRDLRTAALNVERAHALYGVQRSELLPSVNASGSGEKYRTSGKLLGDGQPAVDEQYSVNLGLASWELDFFGRIRSLTEQALAEYLATEDAHRTAHIALIAQVAQAYLTLAADRESLTLARSTLTNQQAVADLQRRRFTVGVAPELYFFQAQTRVDAARVDVALYTRLVAQDENALNLLAGTAIPTELLPVELGSVKPPQQISPGLTSDVLLERPDVLQAEERLKGANANIGAARAAFFPRISLTAALGTASNELSGLFKPNSNTWSFTPQIVMPIFDARTWWALETVEADQKIALAQYEKAIQNAFKETADALAIQGTVADQLASQESLVHSVAETYRLSTARYEKGIDSFLGVLDAQRSLYEAQQGLIAIRLLRLANEVKLYAVLGGGAL